MADGMYIGMAAAAARAAQLDSVSDNLANAQTPGFKAMRPAFQSFLPDERTDKVLAAPVATGLDLRPGVTVATERPLDLLPPPDTFLAVQTASGARAYTRNGNLQVASDGTLLAAGAALLDREGQPIQVPMDAIPTINELGEVIVEEHPVATIGLFRIDGPIDRTSPNLLGPGEGAQVTAVDQGRVRVGELEMGNAPALEATLQMISAQRQFDAAMQAIQTYRTIDQRAMELGKIR